MKIETTPPVEPEYTLTLSATELAVIAAALGVCNCSKMAGPGPFYIIATALKDSGIDINVRAAAAGLRVPDRAGGWRQPL